MKKALFFLFALFSFSLVTAAQPAAPTNPAIREIKKPTFGNPAFLLPGGSVSVEFSSAAEGRASAAVLIPSLGDGAAATITLNIELKTGTNTLEIRLPDQAQPGLYDLCIDFGVQGVESRDCQRHSVSIVKSFDAPFTFVQISDYHMGDPRAGHMFPGVDIERVRIAALETANKLNPAFALVTGDINAYPVSYEQDYPHSVQELLDNARIPLIIIPGNHDFYSLSDDAGKPLIDGRSIWPDFFGPTHTILDFGIFRFICFDSYDWPFAPRNQNKEFQSASGTTHTYSGTLSRSEFEWVRSALDGKGNRIPVLVGHHGPRQFEAFAAQWCKDCVSMGKFLSMINKYKVPYYFYGHIHKSMEVKEHNTQYFATTSVGSDADPKDLWGIRVAHAAPDGTITTEIIKLFDTPPMTK